MLSEGVGKNPLGSDGWLQSIFIFVAIKPWNIEPIFVYCSLAWSFFPLSGKFAICNFTDHGIL